LFRSVYGQLPPNPSFANLGHPLSTWSSPKAQVLINCQIFIFIVC
jgi:hypothetical protein